MENKGIYIDGVDISECEHVFARISLFERKNFVECTAFFLENEDSRCNCSDNPNCYYKQLKRKERECEELKIYIESNEQQVKEVETLVMDNDRLINELDQLKQTLTEIKKIAEILAPMTNEYENCHDRDRCFECVFTEDCSYFNTKRIIQICDEATDE